MIAPSLTPGSAPLLRKEFSLREDHGPVVAASMYVTSHGIFEATVGGTPVDDDLFSPGWSSYEWRLRYRSYDVRHLLERQNVLGISLGNGWWRGRLAWTGGGAWYGDRLAALAQLEITYADGFVQFVLTDETWSAGASEVIFDDLYDGQTIDARLVDHSWTKPGTEPEGWGPVDAVPFDASILTPYIGPAVRREDAIKPVSIFASPSGKTLIDFGQNLVGFLRFSVRGEPGDEIVIRHAEVLEDGEIGVRPLRTARATDRLILSGGHDHFEPTKTFHGFRYAEISGWPGALTVDSLEAVVVHSALHRTGFFECSDERLNQLHSNVVWGLRGNFVDLPTDCPQRDERLGWTGDIAVFVPTAAFLYNVDGFLRDWLKDVAAEQEAAAGVVPFVVPDVLKRIPEIRAQELFALFDGTVPPTAIWGDAAVWVPWALWTAYGDLEVLETQYESMAAHLQSAAARLSPSGLWDEGFQFGDWLDPTAPPNNPLEAKASSGVVATACLYRTATMVAEAAQLTDRAQDAAAFVALAGRIRRAFTEHYVREDGRIHSDAATVYALAIVFGLLDEPHRQLAGDRLAELVQASGHHISTGFAGTPYVADALTLTGHLGDAYKLLLQEGAPSWLYQVAMGATTVWERWDSMLPDGSINPGEMTSFNHYALGGIADWMHRTLAGLAPLEPGYRKVLVAPRPGGGLTWARANLLTPQGRVDVEWRIEDNNLIVEIELPAGSSAVVDLPGRAPHELAPGRHCVVVDNAVETLV